MIEELCRDMTQFDSAVLFQELGISFNKVRNSKNRIYFPLYKKQFILQLLINQ